MGTREYGPFKRYPCNRGEKKNFKKCRNSMRPPHAAGFFFFNARRLLTTRTATARNSWFSDVPAIGRHKTILCLRICIRSVFTIQPESESLLLLNCLLNVYSTKAKKQKPTKQRATREKFFT